MSFIVAHGDVLAKGLWQNTIPRLLKDKPQSELTNRDIVPRTKEALLDWCKVVRVRDAADPTRAHILCHLNEANPGAKEEVVLRLQGFVAKIDLSKGGNWDNTTSGCSKALHTVFLESGGCEGPYLAQLEALHNIRTFIQESLRCEPVDFKPWSTLKLQHRVFTMVRANRPTPKSIVGKYSDPGGHFRKVAKQWVPVDAVMTGKQDASGKVYGCIPKEIGIGDFVDVTVRVEIAQYSRGGSTTTQVYWNVVRVVQLQSAKQRIDEEQTATTSEVVADVGFEFDEAPQAGRSTNN